MGYYTAFDLNISTRDGKSISHMDEYRRKELKSALEALEVFEVVGDDGTCWGYAKWYDHNDDMMKLSRRFPKLLFELYGDGEESDDLWKSYYFAGGYQYCPADISYDEFDSKKLSYIV